MEFTDFFCCDRGASIFANFNSRQRCLVGMATILFTCRWYCSLLLLLSLFIFFYKMKRAKAESIISATGRHLYKRNYTVIWSAINLPFDLGNWRLSEVNQIDSSFP